MGEQVLKLNAQGLIPCSQDLGMDVSVGGDLTDWTDEDSVLESRVIPDTLPESLIVIPETQQTLPESLVVYETQEFVIPETSPESIVVRVTFSTKQKHCDKPYLWPR
jgi:hypothetical protein